MIYCITLIIIVALICVTRLYPLWVEHDRKKVEKAMELVAKIREENRNLQKQNAEVIEEWMKELKQTSDSFNKTWDHLYEICEKLEIRI